jgi:hypothetical protein
VVFLVGQPQGDTGSLIGLTFQFNVPAMGITDALDVVQSESKPFDIVHISGGDPIKFREYALLVFRWDSYALILDVNSQAFLFILGGYMNLGRFPCNIWMRYPGGCK